MNIKKLRRLCSEVVEEDDPETRIAVAACRLASVGGIGLLVQNSGVNRSSALCYGLEIQIVAFHFDQHEIRSVSKPASIWLESLRLLNLSCPELPRTK